MVVIKTKDLLLLIKLMALIKHLLLVMAQIKHLLLLIVVIKDQMQLFHHLETMFAQLSSIRTTISQEKMLDSPMETTI